VLSRCQRHEFRRLPLDEMVAQLEMICKQEGIKAEKAALELIARQATGSLRDAESLLDQLASTGGEVKLDWAQEVLGTSTSLAVLDLLDALVAKDAAAGLDLIHKTLDAGSDPRQFARQIVDALRGLLLLHMGAPLGPEHAGEESQRMIKQAKAFNVMELLRVIRLFHETTSSEAKTAWLPSLPLDLAYVEAIEAPAPSQNRAPAAQEQPRSELAAAPRAAPQPPPRAASPDATPAPASAHLDGQVWTRIKDAVKGRDIHLLALLNSVKTRELRGNVLVLGFASDLLKAKMEKPENMELFSSILDDTLGQNLQVTCMLASGRGGELPPDLDSSGMVAAAVRLGGEIVDKTDLSKGE
jgi:DNA polymerase-3 subunit gamma/tau